MWAWRGGAQATTLLLSEGTIWFDQPCMDLCLNARS
eukprot:COSAG05_NODE_5714_length_1109_cov_1.467327_3_plen_35_part_01